MTDPNKHYDFVTKKIAKFKDGRIVELKDN